MTLAERITHFRLVAGLNQAQLAEKAGVSAGTVCMWEQGESAKKPFKPSQASLERLCAALDISLAKFWADDPTAATDSDEAAAG